VAHNIKLAILCRNLT